MCELCDAQAEFAEHMDVRRYISDLKNIRAMLIVEGDEDIAFEVTNTIAECQVCFIEPRFM